LFLHTARMSLPDVRASASALVIALLALSGCRAETSDSAASASRGAAAVAPLADSEVGAALADRAARRRVGQGDRSPAALAGGRTATEPRHQLSA
jgi:hypothetical protein